MTKVSNAMATYDVTTNREDLSDVVYKIAPADTPFLSAVPRTKASNVLHEWSTQDLQSINTTNAHMEGDETTRLAATAPVRRQNYCQISKRNATVTGTERASNPAGISDMKAHQLALKSIELKKDVEYILLSNQGQNAGNTSTARLLRSFNSWISGNGSRSGATTGGGADAANATSAATDATAGNLRTFSEDLLKDAILDAYNDGGEPTMVLVGAFNKQKFSTFTGRASARENVSIGRVQGAASLYASDFGDLKVVPNRTQRARDAWVIDPDKVAVSYLRPFQSYSLGRIGDADTEELLVEYTLEMRHPDAHALVADLTSS